VEQDAPRSRADDPEDRLQRRRLPGRVAAEQADELALAHLDVHVLQDVDQSVVGVDPLELQQRCDVLGHSRSAAPSPRYASITFGSVATCSNDPSAIFTPWSSA